MPDGRIEPRQAERLREIGKWLQRYGQGVYGTRGGPFKPGAWGASTCRDDLIYLFVMKWPDQGPVQLPAINTALHSARALTGGEVTVRESPDAIALVLPAADRDPIVTVIELKLAGPSWDVPPCEVGG
jgi:alpha-L-fucosidase